MGAEKHPILHETITALCDDLLVNGWCLDDGESAQPEPGGFFYSVLVKHMEPLIDVESWREARIAALKAELAALTPREASVPEMEEVEG